MPHLRFLPGLLLAGTSLASAAAPELKLHDAAASALHVGTPAVMLEIEGRPVAVRRGHSRALPSGDVAWSGSWGSTAQAAAGELSLVRSAAGITGIVRTGEDRLRIVPVGGGQHRTLPLSTRKLPMHPPVDVPQGRLQAAAGDALDIAPTSRIRLLVLATA